MLYVLNNQAKQSSSVEAGNVLLGYKNIQAP